MPPRKNETAEKEQCVGTASYITALEKQLHRARLILRAKEDTLQRQRSRIAMLEETVDELNIIIGDMNAEQKYQEL